MTTEQLERVLDNWTVNYVAPVCDTQLGRELFFAGHNFSRCRNELQRTGWREAEKDARRIVMDESMLADMHGIRGMA